MGPPSRAGQGSLGWGQPPPPPPPSLTPPSAAEAPAAEAPAAEAPAPDTPPSRAGRTGLRKAPSSSYPEGWSPPRDASEPRTPSASDPQLEAMRWVAAVTGRPLPADADWQEWLASGVVLCELIRHVADGTGAEIGEIKVSTSEMPFKQMENIGNYVRACGDFGVPAQDLFMTVDLYEAKNMAAVTRNLHSLGRIARERGFDGPSLGARLAKKNTRTFTPAQLAEAKAMPARWTNRGNSIDAIERSSE